MAALLLLLAILGAGVVADLVVENSGTGTSTVLGHPITGYRDGLLLAAALGLVIGLLAVGSLSLRRTRRARRKQLHSAERQLLELEGENARLREELARRDAAARRVAGVAAAAGLDPPAAAGTVPPPLADDQVEPIDEEARRVARARSSVELSLPSIHR
jgi:hypothetical protein